MEKFLSVDKEDIDRAHLESTGEQQHEHGASSSSSDLQLDWELHKPRSEAVRFTCEVKLYLSTKSDLAERTDMKADPGKVAAAYMRMIRNPDSSGMFERKVWLTSLEFTADWRLQEGDRQAKKLRRGKVLIESAL